ncbi:HNH endonuclease [Mesorhizobium sp. M6A.T.Ce.TU.002.03.1.1]|nr:HNH endonuclease [Mesorhizobium sp. M6A.T.Ce.TU.002.03.1.1]
MRWGRRLRQAAANARLDLGSRSWSLYQKGGEPTPMKKKLKFNSAKVRSELVEIQGGKCYYCREPFTETGPKQATLEHKKPKMLGGTNERSNLAAACRKCNQSAGRRMNAAKQRKAMGAERSNAPGV